MPSGTYYKRSYVIRYSSLSECHWSMAIITLLACRTGESIGVMVDAMHSEFRCHTVALLLRVTARRFSHCAASKFRGHLLPYRGHNRNGISVCIWFGVHISQNFIDSWPLITFCWLAVQANLFHYYPGSLFIVDKDLYIFDSRFVICNATWNCHSDD